MDEPLNKQITELRKAGMLSEAWELGCPAVQEYPNNMYIKGAFFWLCYDYIKLVQTDIKTRSNQNNPSRQPSHSDLKRINFYLDWIIWLNIPQGGLEYRLLLISCQRNLEHIPKLVQILMPINLGLFESEDKKPFINDKGESPSLMLKFCRAVAKAWIHHEQIRQISIDDICALLSRTRAETSDEKNLIWLDNDEAKCLIIAKRWEQATQCTLRVLRKKQTEFWAWSSLAIIYRDQDGGQNKDAAISLFAKALSCAKEEQFAGKVLKNLAPLLAAQDLHSEASVCIKRAAKLCQDNNWPIRADLEQLLNQPWYMPDVNNDVLNKFIKSRSDAALEYLFGEREKHFAVVQSIHKSNKGFDVYLNKEKSLPVRLGLYKVKTLPKIGDFVRMYLSSEDGSIISAEPCTQQQMDDVGYEKGVLRAKEKGFGFVNDTYVPPWLIDEAMHGKEVYIMRIVSWNKKKERFSWTALSIRLDD